MCLVYQWQNLIAVLAQQPITGCHNNLTIHRALVMDITALPDGFLDPPQTVNLIAPWQLIAAYDRYQDDQLLERARQAAEWFYTHHIVDHPMAIVAVACGMGLQLMKSGPV